MQNFVKHNHFKMGGRTFFCFVNNFITFVPLTRYETYKKSYHSALPKA